MPRIKMGFENQPKRTDAKLVARLVDELKTNRESGQPFIFEQPFSTGKIRILVIWDDWKDLPLEERTSIILTAVERSDGKDYRAKVALASGLTVPEGVAAGMLPYQIISAHRKGDKRRSSNVGTQWWRKAPRSFSARTSSNCDSRQRIRQKPVASDLSGAYPIATKSGSSAGRSRLKISGK